MDPLIDFLAIWHADMWEALRFLSWLVRLALPHVLRRLNARREEPTRTATMRMRTRRAPRRDRGNIGRGTEPGRTRHQPPPTHHGTPPDAADAATGSHDGHKSDPSASTAGCSGNPHVRHVRHRIGSAPIDARHSDTHRGHTPSRSVAAE